MRALVKTRDSVVLDRVSRPEPGPDEVLVQVAAAGVCRTDLYAATGRLDCAERVVLGHEFSGTIAGLGSGVRGLAEGERVAALPFVSCGRCGRCAAGGRSACPRPRMLGVDLPGAFAEFVSVPARLVERLPQGVSFRAGAYAEPVAASLGVLRTGIQPRERGLIYGDNRIACLTQRILRARGFDGVELYDPEGPELAEDAYDFIIETLPSGEAFTRMLRALRPGGRIVLKSRPSVPVSLDLAAAVRKEATLQAASYAPFSESVALIASGLLDLSDLLGPLRPLEDFKTVFAEASASESFKSFFSPRGGDVRDP